MIINEERNAKKKDEDRSKHWNIIRKWRTLCYKSEDQTISEDQRRKTKDEHGSPKNEIKQKVLLREREENGKESRQDKTLYESCGASLAGRNELN